MNRGVRALSLLLVSAGCSPARPPAEEPTGASEPTSNHTMEPPEEPPGATGGAPTELTLPPPPREETLAESPEVAGPPSPWQSCQTDAECTARSAGCCSPCDASGYVPMRVNHANALQAQCRREPVACPACAAPMPPQAFCDAGVCAVRQR